MSLPLYNIQELKNNMSNHKWIIDSFMFTFNADTYITLVNLDFKKQNEFASVLLTFYDFDNDQRTLTCEANRLRLLIDDSTIFEFFDFHPNGHAGNSIRYFLNQLGKAIPPISIENKSSQETKLLHTLASKIDSKNSGRYCYKTIRHTGNKERSKCNNTKVRILRPDLYEVLGKDRSISFCFTDDSTKHKTKTQILSNLNIYI